MYHVNNEGKIYPCRAVIKACPYGVERHSSNLYELYNIILREDYPNVRTPDEVTREITATGRLRSLFRLSKEIENVPHPVETIIQTLSLAINMQKDISETNLKKKYITYYQNISNYLFAAMRRNLHDQIPHWVPKEIYNTVYENARLHSEIKGEHLLPRVTNPELIESISLFKDLSEDYEEYKRYRVTKDNYNKNLRWLKEDYYQFSHDLNTSKMLTQPVFYGNLKKARQTIANFNDEELLAAYDDYLASDEEILQNIVRANNFNYKNRNDLSPEANAKLKRWYDMNRKLASNWESNKAKRILIAMELAKELDIRKIPRQERRRRY